ncbi:SpoIIAA family protein [Roseimaritima multifibrata]|nr:STAS/SEC14 domain-containing protein [Roseimaritima multifibrata]
MSFSVTEIENGKTIELSLTGKLSSEAYEEFVPVIEAQIAAHGKVRMLVVMHDFHGWDASALWADTKFAMKHFKDIERLAIVGETKWEKGMATFCKPFTTASIKYFDHAKIDDARAWLQESA